MIEYPKALYLNGVCLNVDSAEQEEAARADGYDDWHADFDRMNAPAVADAADEPVDRDTLKARAAELGIAHAPNITTDKLAALVAAVQG